VLPLTENIGHRALVYIEEYGISSGMRAGDALVAATAVENGMTLATCNAKHFRSVKDLDLHILKI
jgi:predicted nucleic acid-binding protein